MNPEILKPKEVTNLYKENPTADPDLGKLYNAGIFNQTTSDTTNTDEPTVGSLGFQSPTSTDPYGDAVNQYYQSTQNVNDDDIRSNVLKQFQGEIDATKRSYSQLLNEQKQLGQGRLGEDTAIQARRGMLGSNFGQALTEKTRGLNLTQEEKVRAAESAALAAIKAQALGLAQQEIAANKAAKLQGSQAWLQSLRTKPERKNAALANLANAFLTQNKNPLEMSQTELQKIVDESNGFFTTNDIINAYLNRKETKTAEEAKANAPVTLSQGESRVVYNPETGEYETVASVAPKPASTTLTPYQQFSATQAISKDTQKRTENAREMARQAQLIESSYNNIVKGGDRSLNTQAIVTSFNKILDPTSVVRESEYDRTAAGQSLIAQLEGKVQQIASGGAGITDETIKEAAEIARQYLKQSQQSITTENERARAMAEQFGLNQDFVTTGDFQTGTEFEEQW